METGSLKTGTGSGQAAEVQSISGSVQSRTNETAKKPERVWHGGIRAAIS
jgi:hypothetical protein